MLRTGHADPAWFSQSFLEQVPASKVDETIASLTAQLGAYQSLEFAKTKFVAHFAKGTDDVLIHLDAEDKIDGLFFRPPLLAATTLDSALSALRAAQGTVSYVIVEEGRPERAAFNADAPMAVGSAFKLAVLSALLDQIRAGKRRWTDVVPLQASWKSLPSGIIRTWPDGIPLTIATYAAQMISISDNTAADALVHIVGRPALAPYAESNVPFLTTREMFTLKSTGGSALRAAYLAAGTPAARAAVLARVDQQPLPAAADFIRQPILPIEWHYSVRDLCRLMSRVASLPVMSINPGVADRSEFARVAFKGGSEPGVLNLTTMVVTKRGTRVCFSATENDAEKPLDETAFEFKYSAALMKLAAL